MGSQVYLRGQVWYVEDKGLNKHAHDDNEQAGSRPWVIISSNAGNKSSSFVTCLACSGKVEKARMKINVLYHSDYSGKDSVILGNQVKNINKKDIVSGGKYWETLDDETMHRVEEAYAYALGIKASERLDLTKLEDICKRIAEERIKEIKLADERQREITDDMVIDIAAGLENLFHSYARKSEKLKPKEGDYDNVGPGVLMLHNAVTKKKENTEEVSKPVENLVESVEKKKKKQPSSRKPKGFWTEERMLEYCKDKQTMKITELREKWDLDDSDMAMRLYYTCRKNLHKRGYESE